MQSARAGAKPEDGNCTQAAFVQSWSALPQAIVRGLYCLYCTGSSTSLHLPILKNVKATDPDIVTS